MLPASAPGFEFRIVAWRVIVRHSNGAVNRVAGRCATKIRGRHQLNQPSVFCTPAIIFARTQGTGLFELSYIFLLYQHTARVPLRLTKTPSAVPTDLESARLAPSLIQGIRAFHSHSTTNTRLHRQDKSESIVDFDCSITKTPNSSALCRWSTLNPFQTAGRPSLPQWRTYASPSVFKD